MNNQFIEKIEKDLEDFLNNQADYQIQPEGDPYWRVNLAKETSSQGTNMKQAHVAIDKVITELLNRIEEIEVAVKRAEEEKSFLEEQANVLMAESNRLHTKK